MNCSYIIAMRLDQRTQTATTVQETLTAFGCNIKTRIGLHDLSDDFCANYGMIILHICGAKDEMDKLLAGLNKLSGVKAKLIEID